MPKPTTQNASRSPFRAVCESNSGTTTACYYATTHLESTITFAKVIQKEHQRAFVGKVNMDRNSPEYYTETTSSSIQATKDFVQQIMALESPLITPVLTPRFVPSCTPELMSFLGSFAKDNGIPIQSHLSETHGELAWVKELHPDTKDYASVYDSFELLTDMTVMAHCIHLSKSERDLLKERKVGISHCASSNFSLGSGVLNLRRLLDEGHEKIGLGTDVAGIA
jgi:guanine deaminase